MRISWWRHQLETFFALLAICMICAWNSPVTGEFPAQRPVTQSFDVFFDLRLNERLSKHSWGWYLRRHRAHYDVTVTYDLCITWRNMVYLLICIIQPYWTYDLCYQCLSWNASIIFSPKLGQWNILFLVEYAHVLVYWDQVALHESVN